MADSTRSTRRPRSKGAGRQPAWRTHPIARKWDNAGDDLVDGLFDLVGELVFALVDSGGLNRLAFGRALAHRLVELWRRGEGKDDPRAWFLRRLAEDLCGGAQLRVVDGKAASSPAADLDVILAALGYGTDAVNDDGAALGGDQTVPGGAHDAPWQGGPDDPASA